MDINDFRSVITLLAFLTFIGIVIWAYHGKSRRNFDEAAQLPLIDDATDAAPAASRPQGK
ncbi:MAG: cbb3-type cytochrome c oxidase subunit 3 [Burkholderiaceae bacterium]|jgi:cytochrome c oxidase cbb3-type subunit 4|nr:cbb3-type cytochrome c oxidase subunit 3 [Burkholderiaceae bacterium]